MTAPMPEHLRRLFDPNDTYTAECMAEKFGKPVYYALESLPALLGDRQFKLLCDALNIRFEGGTPKQQGAVFDLEVEEKARRQRERA